MSTVVADQPHLNTSCQTINSNLEYSTLKDLSTDLQRDSAKQTQKDSVPMTDNRIGQKTHATLSVNFFEELSNFYKLHRLKISTNYFKNLLNCGKPCIHMPAATFQKFAEFSK